MRAEGKKDAGWGSWDLDGPKRRISLTVESLRQKPFGRGPVFEWVGPAAIYNLPTLSEATASQALTILSFSKSESFRYA